MIGILGLLNVVLLILLIVGLIKPALVLRWVNKPTRLKVIGFYFLSIILTGVSGTLYKSTTKTDSKTGIKKENPKREKELKLIHFYKKREFKKVTDKDGFIQKFSIDKKNIDYISMGKSKIYKYSGEYGELNSNYLEVGVRKVLLTLKINGIIQHKITIVEQVYNVIYKFESGGKKVEELFFQPELESLDRRKIVFEYIDDLYYNGKWLGAGHNSEQWTKKYQDIIKSSGVLEINTFMDFLKLSIATSDINQ